MSYSYRHTPIRGVTKCESEKQDKCLAHRRFRRANHMALDTAFAMVDLWYREEIYPHERRYSDPWLYGKDGKCWFGYNPLNEKWLRK